MKYSFPLSCSKITFPTFLSLSLSLFYFVYFWSFQTYNTFLQHINVKKCHVHPVYGARIRTTTFGT